MTQLNLLKLNNVDFTDDNNVSRNLINKYHKLGAS
jgi:hypothetical protein